MRIVQLKLRPPTMFWNLSTISLQRGKKEVSQLINIDNLNEAQMTIINRSIAAQEIMLYDSEGNRIFGNLSNVNLFNGSFVSEEDIEEEKNIMPEVISVTVDNDEEVEEEEEEQIDLDTILEDVKFLLSKHWSTIKKTVAEFERSSYNLNLIHTAIEIEEATKNRQGVLNVLQQALKDQ